MTRGLVRNGALVVGADGNLEIRGPLAAVWADLQAHGSILETDEGTLTIETTTRPVIHQRAGMCSLTGWSGASTPGVPRRKVLRIIL